MASKREFELIHEVKEGDFALRIYGDNVLHDVTIAIVLCDVNTKDPKNEQVLYKLSADEVLTSIKNSWYQLDNNPPPDGLNIFWMFQQLDNANEYIKEHLRDVALETFL
jgi:hypothetical protein